MKRKLSRREKELAEKENELGEKEKELADKEKVLVEKESALSGLKDTLWEGGQLRSGKERAMNSWFVALDADALLVEGKLEEGLRRVNEALEENSENPMAWFIKGRILKRLYQRVGNSELLKQALENVSKAAERLPKMAAPLYNKACYQALLRANGNKDEVLRNLRHAIELNPELRAEARKDEDFASLRDDEDFRKLTDDSA